MKSLRHKTCPVYDSVKEFQKLKIGPKNRSQCPDMTPQVPSLTPVKQFYEDKSSATPCGLGASSFPGKFFHSKLISVVGQFGHRQGLAEMKEELDASIQEAVNQAPDVSKSVTYDDAVTEFEIVVDKAAYESNMEAQWIGFGLNFEAMFCQAFAGVAESGRGGVVNLIDEATGDVFDSQKWPVEQLCEQGSPKMPGV